jgi:hypothetical protein
VIMIDSQYPTLCRVKSGAKQQKVDPTSNPNVDRALGMLAKSQV